MGSPGPSAYAISPGSPVVLEARDLRIDVIGRSVVRDGRPLRLRPTELDILVYLIWHRGRVVSGQEMYEQLFGFTFVPSSLRLVVHISRLRAQIDKAGMVSLIRTVRGQGYTMDH